MSDQIKLLPDSIANQIAAGEVIQRPSSVVKELLENALDAKATHINLIVKDAGRTLIQITDNGSGMSQTDARMCFEKHATSKISNADDLFNLNTLGFRGEALASIAAIAHVQLKTKTEDQELGTEIIMEGSELKSQENCSCSIGTSFSVKNLFYNVPARRNFLKSNTAELRHVIEEFQRIALVHPNVSFTFYNNGSVLHQLQKGSLKQRITQVIGKKLDEKLVPIEEQTEDLKIHGFIGKPEFSRKKRGEQYFFANHRFIKHPYFHHAIENAYKELIPDGSFPSYFIYLQVQPEEIDVNIHPTKIEVNFSNKQLIYAILAAAAKKALGQFSLTPSLDFEQEESMSFQFSREKAIKPPSIKINPEYNPFESEKATDPRQISNQENWSKLYNFNEENNETVEPYNAPTSVPSGINFLPETNDQSPSLNNTFIQIGLSFVISSVKSGMVIIDQKLAHERILYEKYLEQYENRQIASQQLLFPVNMNMSAEELSIIQELKDELINFGFDIKTFGHNGIVINGSPTEITESKIPEIIDEIINHFLDGKHLDQDRKLAFARTMARQLAIKYGQKLKQSEMEELADALFSCTIPDVSIDGEQIFKTIGIEEIKSLF